MTFNVQIYTKRDDCCANETITNLLAPYHRNTHRTHLPLPGLGIKSCQIRLDDLLMKTPLNLSRLGIHRRKMNNDNDRQDV